jgi:GTP 3',8-cyclase
MTGLVDRFGRQHRDLRISLTDRCSLRCTYCMPAEGVPWLARSTMLSTEEILRVARVGVENGITEVRLTGGEPLLRVDVVDIVRRLTALPNAPEVSLTTNALRLPALAAPLRDAGLSRVNISLDTLDRARFMELTRRDKLVETLAGIAAADAAGLRPVKINAVAMRGVNDDEVVALTRFAVDRGYQMRFIEQMPLDGGHTWDRTEMVTQAEILDRLSSEFTLTEVEGRGAAPAELWYVDGGPQTVGVIASVTAPFCGACDRLRLTADGQLRACLFSEAEVDTRVILRDGGTDDDLADAYRRCLAGKRAGHGIGEPGFHQPDRPMSAIGG